MFAFRVSRRIGGPDEPQGETLVFLLRNGTIADANFPAKRLLDKTLPPNGTAMDSLRLYLSRIFPDADRLLSSDTSTGDMTAESFDGQVHLVRQTISTSVRLIISYVEAGNPAPVDIHSQRAVHDELELLRANTQAAPFLLWRQNRDGQVTWVNQVYLDTVRDIHPEHTVQEWPLPQLFPGLSSLPGESESRRMSIPLRDGEQAWYDCHTTPVGRDVLCTAFRADEAVRSENRRREFTQTLTKTFAELAIGLAIFDRSRQLVLFNPALLDLTNLPTDFLTSRPSLVRFLDKLRENRAMPEPRDYRSWRASISELEAAAVDGTYSETWSLPDGQTYHVTGRPHPDGAVALLFEDISAEMSLTRRFRAELEQSQSVIDEFDEAVAVFSSTGDLSMTNAAYDALWGAQPDEVTLAGVSVRETTRIWHDMTAPTPAWGDFRDFALGGKDRGAWTANVTLLDGRGLACRFVPQKGGATLAMFRIIQGESATGNDLREAV